MKKIILIFIVLQISVFSLQAQDASNEKAELLRTNQELGASFKAEKWDESLKLAQKAINLNIKIYGEETIETAAAFKNLAIIYRAKKKFDDAIVNFQKAVKIYRLDADKNEKSIVRTLYDVAVTYYLNEDFWQANKFGLESLSLAEKVFGKESKDILLFLVMMREIYTKLNKYNETEDMYIRQYLTARKYFDEDSDELQEIEDSFSCFAYYNFGMSVSKPRLDRFKAAIKPKKDNTTISEEATNFFEEGKLNGGIINGKAKKLVVPNYPQGARNRFAQGIVLVRVVIDEQGEVESAKAFCGDKDLRKASESAARASKFSPTIFDGKAVKVTGTIVYNFVQ